MKKEIEDVYVNYQQECRQKKRKNRIKFLLEQTGLQYFSRLNSSYENEKYGVHLLSVIALCISIGALCIALCSFCAI